MSVADAPMDLTFGADDEAFLAVAASAHAAALVTGNLRHFPPHLRQGVRVATPAELVEMLRSDAR